MRRAVAVAIFVVAAMAMPAVANAAVHTYPSAECPKASGSGSGSGLDKCINNVAARGDTVTVKPGTYFEQNISVSKAGLRVSGSCPSLAGSPPSSRIDAGIGGSNSGSGDGFDIHAAGVTIQCLTIRHAGGSHDGINNDLGAFDFVSVVGDWIVDSQDAVDQGGGGVLRVIGSTIKGTSSDGIFQAGTSFGDTISHNKITQTSSDGVDFSDTSGSRIVNNLVGPAGSQGIVIDGGDGNVVSNNSLHTIQSDCIDFISTNTTVASNTMRGCDSTGIFTDVDGATVRNNTFTGKVDGDTIEVDCSDNAVIAGNRQLSGGTDDDPFIFACNDPGTSITIRNNVERGFVSHGVECSTCHSASITGNSFTGGGESSGVDFFGTHPIVNNNTVSGGWDSDGVFVRCTSDCAGTSVSGNAATRCSDGCPGFFIETSGCSAFPCMRIWGNSAADNTGRGFDLEVSFSKISQNTSNANGVTFGGCTLAGFHLAGSGDNEVSFNVAKRNACQGFDVSEGDDSIHGNAASGNVIHGFEVEDVSGNALNHNFSTNNHGDGFNNDGFGTAFTNNAASGNRQDCTNDGGESATLGFVGSNNCVDGTNFGVDSNLTAW